MDPQTREQLMQEYEHSANTYVALYHYPSGTHTLVLEEKNNHVLVVKKLSVYNERVYAYLKEHHHKNLANVVDYWMNEDGFHVAEEFIQGTRLDEMLKGQMTWAEKCSVFEQVCDGVSFLHHADPVIIHRDIKPANIMISDDGVVRLIDFDAAKIPDASKNRDTVLIGTEGSAAPEQYGFGQSDVRTDVYGLGVLLKEMFPEIDALEPVIHKATRMDADERYQSVDALKRAFDMALNTNDGSSEGLHFADKISSDRLQGDEQDSTEDYFSPHSPGYIWMLPGFRTRTPWKILVALAGYALIFYASLTLHVERMVNTADLWMNRIAFLIASLLMVWVMAGYRPITDHLPGFDQGSSVRKVVTRILYGVGSFLLVILIMIFIETLTFK